MSRQETPPTVAAGTLVDGRYEVESLLASGGMADVFRALDRRLGREIALKVFRAAPADRIRFARETALLARLDHPNLVRLLDGRDIDDPDLDGIAYIALQLADGPTLATLLQDGPLPADRVAQIGSDIAEALSYLHREGVVHRDIKPSNVLTTSDGHVLLGDLGVALVADTTGLTMAGTTIGTAAYFAPEQLTGEVVGPAADIYALGLVVLECLNGSPAFTGTPDEVALARLARDPELLAVPNQAWRDLLSAMFARNPADRPDADTVSRSLRQLASESEVAATATASSADATASATAVLPAAATVTAAIEATPARPVEPDAPRPPSPPSRRRLFFAVVVLAALAAIAVGAFLSGRANDGTLTPTSTIPAAPTTATTAPTTAPPATTAAPQTTAPSCADLQAQLEAIESQQRSLDDQGLTGKAKDQAKRNLDDQKKAIQDQMRGC